MTLEEKFRRACVLIQLLLNTDFDDLFQVEEDAREQLKDWGIKVPERRDEE